MVTPEEDVLIMFLIKMFYRLIQMKIVRELIFWIAAYFVLLNIFTSKSPWKPIDHIYTSIFMITLIVAVTINSWILIPRYLGEKKYGWFAFSGVLNILIATFFNQVLFDRIIDYILPGYYFISYYGYVDLLKFFFVFVALSTLIHLSWEWFFLQETRHELMVLAKEKSEAELKALTAQVNPHFLFNSLTVLYSLSLKNSADTSGAIIKLSDILRYVIYESATERVTLRSETDLIRNYIDLQRYRIHPSTQIEFTAAVEDENLTMVPMILLPLVENSFKHGAKGDTQNTFIHIRLESAGRVVIFDISNNKGAAVDRHVGGIGLRNIEERLKLLYSGHYTFQVTDEKDKFNVRLTLQTKA